MTHRPAPFAPGDNVVPLPERDDGGRETGLAAEMDRIAVLLRALQLHRDGKTADAELKRSLAEAQARVTTSRASGFWMRIQEMAVGEEADEAARGLGLDLIAASLYPSFRPSSLALVNALQGGAPDGALTQAFIHELLLAAPAEEALLHRLLSPVSPLRTTGLLRIEGEGPLRRALPGPALLRMLRPDDAFGELPAGMRLVRHITPSTGAVFSARTRAQIEEVVALARWQARLDAVGERRGPGGPAVLFAGGPGTGKTLAAREIASRIGQPLFQLDLGAVVSKWVGETEKNLSRIFERMSGAGGAILIDEADAILSKRVAMKEGRDQFVNLTVGHLLTLIEQHRGLVMLTTNLRSNLDDAYLRRIALVVEFSAPDALLRREMWLKALEGVACSPSRQALAEMASAIDMTGAEIANAARLATALAAAGGQAVSEAPLARAIWREKTKAAMTFTRQDLRALGPSLEVQP